MRAVVLLAVIMQLGAALKGPAGRVVVVGGGASGYFAAISAAHNGAAHVEILESASKGLSKVLASGGGRCNVMHREMDVGDLVKRYPRGEKELRGPLTKGWGQRETRAFFEAEGVRLKTEADGRVFPTTDDAATIADALRGAAQRAGVEVRFGHAVTTVSCHHEDGGGFVVETRDRATKTTAVRPCDAVVVATGSAPIGYAIAQALGHTVTAPYPSLFSLRVAESPLKDLAGVSLDDAELEFVMIEGAKKKKKKKNHNSPLIQRGPVLVTHRGVSGPAVLKLSAFAAAELKAADYRGELLLNSLPDLAPAEVLDAITAHRTTHAAQRVCGTNPNRPFHDAIPKRLWQALAKAALGAAANPRWAELSNRDAAALAATLSALRLAFHGKDTNKDEFVTAGGVALKELDLRRFASKVVPGLHFAGELLNVDGVTGGHNFQNCWTSGWLAGASAAKLALGESGDGADR